MPSSMIFVSLVVLWLLILVPAVARHRQEVARPSVTALSGRVLERPRQRRRNTVGRGSQVGHEPEVYVMDERRVATRTDPDREVHVPAARFEPRWREDEPGDHLGAQPLDDDVEEAAGDDPGGDDPGGDYPGGERRWERPPPRYRPGRGGYDPEVARLTARARYAFRQRVVLALLLVAVVTGVVAFFAVPELWLPHVAADLTLVGYLCYLRRQVRLEETIRERRAARLAGGRRPPARDEWDADTDDLDLGRRDFRVDDLARERPERVRGTGEPLVTPADDGPRADPIDGEPALPRLRPAPPPPLPPGTALVCDDEDDPDMHDLDSHVRLDYRRAAGE